MWFPAMRLIAKRTCVIDWLGYRRCLTFCLPAHFIWLPIDNNNLHHWLFISYRHIINIMIRFSRYYCCISEFAFNFVGKNWNLNVKIVCFAGRRHCIGSKCGTSNFVRPNAPALFPFKYYISCRAASKWTDGTQNTGISVDKDASEFRPFVLDRKKKNHIYLFCLLSLWRSPQLRRANWKSLSHFARAEANEFPTDFTHDQSIINF